MRDGCLLEGMDGCLWRICGEKWMNKGRMSSNEAKVDDSSPLYCLFTSLQLYFFPSHLLFFNVLFTVPLHPTFVFLCSPATTLASPPFFLHPIIWWMYKDVLSRQREYGGFKRELSVCITECCTPKAELNSVTPHIKRLIYMFI